MPSDDHYVECSDTPREHRARRLAVRPPASGGTSRRAPPPPTRRAFSELTNASPFRPARPTPLLPVRAASDLGGRFPREQPRVRARGRLAHEAIPPPRPAQALPRRLPGAPRRGRPRRRFRQQQKRRPVRRVVRHAPPRRDRGELAPQERVVQPERRGLAWGAFVESVVETVFTIVCPSTSSSRRCADSAPSSGRRKSRARSAGAVSDTCRRCPHCAQPVVREDPGGRDGRDENESR